MPPIRELIARVDGIDHTSVRLDFIPDRRLVGRQVKKTEFRRKGAFIAEAANRNNIFQIAQKFQRPVEEIPQRTGGTEPQHPG